jgi:glycosyltransferase EpsF
MINIIKPLRVLHIVGGVMDVGGIEMFLMNYYRHIDRDVIQFDFCIVEEGNGHFDHEIRSLGGELHNLPSKKRHPIKHLKGLLHVLKKYRNNPVHMHLDGMNGLYGLIAFLNNNKIRISHSHNTNHLTNSPIKRFIHDSFRLINRLVNNHFAACSNDASLWLHGKKTANRAFIILNAIETDRFLFNQEARTTYREKYNIKNEIVIGHIGRLHYQKNHNFMLKLAKGLLDKKIDFKMIFVGTGELIDSLKVKIKSYNLNNNVILVGKTAIPEAYYNMFDIFILPSIFEGLGISLVEAQANGLPCIISDNIPQEAILNNNITILSIDDSSLWVESTLKIELTRFKDVSDSYDIKNAIIKITEYYLNF